MPSLASTRCKARARAIRRAPAGVLDWLTTRTRPPVAREPRRLRDDRCALCTQRRRPRPTRDRRRADGTRCTSPTRRLVARAAGGTARRGHRPRHPGYDDARRVWNGLIDRHPAVIARCASTADVVEAVAGCPAAPAAGQHPRRRAPGRRQRRLRRRPGDRPVGDEGRARRPDRPHGPGRGRRDAGPTSTGRPSCSGWSRPAARSPRPGSPGSPWAAAWVSCSARYGLGCDNLRSVEIVTADGAVRTASRDEHPDLFWALRGGGRGLGVVTSFEFDLHPLGPAGREGAGALPLRGRRRGCCAAWRDLAPQLPDTVSPEFVLWSIPPDPQIPGGDARRAGRDGRGRVRRPGRGGRRACWRPLAELGTPLMDAGGTVDYVDAAARARPAVPGRRRVLLQVPLPGRADRRRRRRRCSPATPRRPNPQSLIVIRTLGGAVARVGEDESAFAHRARPLQPQHRRRLDRPGSRRRDDRLGAVVVGRHARRSPPAGCTSTSPDSATTPTATRCTDRAPHASTAIRRPTTRTASSPPPRTGPERARGHREGHLRPARAIEGALHAAGGREPAEVGSALLTRCYHRGHR